MCWVGQRHTSAKLLSLGAKVRKDFTKTGLFVNFIFGLMTIWDFFVIALGKSGNHGVSLSSLNLLHTSHGVDLQIQRCYLGGSGYQRLTYPSVKFKDNFFSRVSNSTTYPWSVRQSLDFVHEIQNVNSI